MFEVIRNGQHDKRFVYYGTPGINTAIWYTFTKPPGITFIDITAIGGGGGGGAGRSGSTNQTTRGGGGSGGGAGIASALFLASTLPDVFYISPGCGGSGGSVTANAGGIGIAGNSSIVAVHPDLTNTAFIILSAVGGNGGNGAVGAAAGTAATVSLASNTTNMPLVTMALSYNSSNGTVGDAGTGTVDGGLFTPLTTVNLTVTGGAGGAGCSTTLGRLGSRIANTQYSGNVNPSPIGSTNASNGRIYNLKPFISLGGAGGSSNASATAAAGGPGAFGAGGGGGGGGVTAGAGGSGGPGMVVITCF